MSPARPSPNPRARPPVAPIRRGASPWAATLALAFALSLASAGAATEPAPAANPPAANPPVAHLYGAGTGRFAIISAPGAQGPRLLELAESAWREWREPLGLPARLPAPITVRLVPQNLWEFGDASSRVAAEPGGIVTVWIRAEEAAADSDASALVARERLWLRALAAGALRRKSYLVGADPTLARTPPWLAAAAAEAALIAGRPSLLDAWQTETLRAPRRVALREVFLWAESPPASASTPSTSEPALARAGFGVWLWLRRESGRGPEWDNFVRALVAGESPGLALAREFSRLTPRPAEAREWELAWDVALASLARARTTPVMEPEESRRRLEALARIVVHDVASETERVLPATGEWATRLETWPAAERATRSALLLGEHPRFHPFYRNAAGSLGRAWKALAEGQRDEWRRATEDWSLDLADGRMLEEASARLLDAAEREASPR